LGAGRVVGVVSTPERAEVATAAGADAVHLAGEDWEPADIVVDPVGGDAFRKALRLLRPEGRLLVVGFAAGTIPELKVNKLLLGHTDVVGVNYGGMLAVDQAFPQAAWGDLRRWFEEGRLTPAGVSEHTLEEVPAVLTAFGERRITGKPVAILR